MKNTKMYYSNSTGFVVIPPKKSKNINFDQELTDYIDSLRQEYTIFDNTQRAPFRSDTCQSERGAPFRSDTCQSERGASHSFFWGYNADSNLITADQSSDYVENDIFDQFIKISEWIYSKKYSLGGIFYYRTDNYIEYISTTHTKNFVFHFVLFDKLDITELLKQHPKDHNHIEIILNDALMKIKNKLYSNKTKNNINSFRKIISDTLELNYHSPVGDQKYTFGTKNIIIDARDDLESIKTNYVYDKRIIAEENEFQMHAIQNRLINVENEVKTLRLQNKMLFNILMSAGIITFGIFYTYCTYRFAIYS